MSGLAGRTVVVTRAAEQAGELRVLLEKEKAAVLEVPSIRFVSPDDLSPVDRAIGKIREYDYLVFTSRNAVRFFFERLGGRVLPETLKVVSVGPGTSGALRERGVAADLIPDDANGSERLAAELSARVAPGKTAVLFPKAADAGETLPETLRRVGASVDAVTVYRTVPDERGKTALQKIMREPPPDWITFASSSAVRCFLSLGDGEAVKAWIHNGNIRAASIGAPTSETLRQHGIPVAAQAPLPSLEAMVEAMKQAG